MAHKAKVQKELTKRIYRTAIDNLGNSIDLFIALINRKSTKRKNLNEENY